VVARARRHLRPFREAITVFDVLHCEMYGLENEVHQTIQRTSSNYSTFISPRPPFTNRTASQSYVSMSMRWSRKRPRQERIQGSTNHNLKDGVDLTPKTEPCPLEAPGITTPTRQTHKLARPSTRSRPRARARASPRDARSGGPSTPAAWAWEFGVGKRKGSSLAAVRARPTCGLRAC
jgi:hypothetical protein